MKGFLIVVICLLSFVPFLLVLGRSFNIQETHASFYINHEPIEISTDLELEAIAGKGVGNETDPFILEGWHINAKDYGYGIYIHGTTKHFIIRNCWIEADSSPKDSGIFIDDVYPGTVTIANNTVERCWKGIEIRDINATSIINNSLRFNGAFGISYYGVYEYFSNDTSPYTFFASIENNTCVQNFNIGIYLAGVSNSSITGNLIADNKEYGLYYKYGSCTRFKLNSFIHNEKQVAMDYDWFILSAYFIKDDPDFLTETFRGNYWSDYKGTGNYTVWKGINPFEVLIQVIDLDPLLESPIYYSPPPMYIVELSVLLLIIIIIGAFGGLIAIKSIPQVVSNPLTLQKVYVSIIRSGLVILVIQNVLIGIFVFNFQGMHTFNDIEYISFSIFHLDLLGFTLLGTGFIFYSTLTSETKKQYFLGGLLLLSWVICRIIIQYIIPFGLVLHEYGEPLNFQTFAFYMIYRGFYESNYDLNFPFEDYFGFDSPPVILFLTFMMSGLLLYTASRVIPKIRDERGLAFFKLYGVVNAILCFILPFIYYQERNIIGLFTYNWLTAHIPLFFKVIVVPVLGLCTFGFMLRDSKFLFLLNKPRLEESVECK